jgi:signal transduction histidine kinase
VVISVKQKIVLTLWLITFLLLTLAGTIASVWFSQDQSGRLDDFLSREARGVKDSLETYFAVNSSESPSVDSVSALDFQVFLTDFLAERVNRPLPYKTTMGIFDTRGNLVQESNSALLLNLPQGDPPREVTLTTVNASAPYRIATVALSHGGRVLGSVRMACLTVTLAEVWRSFLASLLIVLGLAFLSFGFLGTFLVRWSLKPVRDMSLSAGDISESHLDLRLAVPPGNDEVAQMARTLNRLLERLERDFEFEEALVGQLSHELRTPLTILRGRNEVALERLAPAQVGTQRILEDNIADIDTIVSLLNTLLNLARLEGRLNPLSLGVCDLTVLLEDLWAELDPLWEEKDLGLALSLPGGGARWSEGLPLMVKGDPILLRQIFLNLLTNAYKYTPRGGVIRIAVTSEGTPEEPVWSLVFANPGPPIPEESLDLVFKRFYRVEVQDPDRHERESGIGQKGFGLGLSIVQTLVDLHGGRVRAFNPPEGGAAFEVRLPRRSVPSGSPERKRRIS